MALSGWQTNPWVSCWLLAWSVFKLSWASPVMSGSFYAYNQVYKSINFCFTLIHLHLFFVSCNRWLWPCFTGRWGPSRWKPASARAPCGTGRDGTAGTSPLSLVRTQQPPAATPTAVLTQTAKPTGNRARLWTEFQWLWKSLLIPASSLRP